MYECFIWGFNNANFIQNLLNELKVKIIDFKINNPWFFKCECSLEQYNFIETKGKNFITEIGIRNINGNDYQEY